MPLLDGMSPYLRRHHVHLACYIPSSKTFLSAPVLGRLGRGAAPHGGRSPADAGGVVA